MPIPPQLRDLQKTQRLHQKIVQSRKTAAQIRIPLLGDPQTIKTNRTFDPLFFLAALDQIRQDPWVRLNVLSWSLHEAGLAELMSLGVWGSLVTIKTSASTLKRISELDPPFQGKTLETRSRARVILAESQKIKMSIYAQGLDVWGETPWVVTIDPSKHQELCSLFANS